MFVVLRDHAGGTDRQAHAARMRHAFDDMVAVGRRVGGAEAAVRVAQAFGHADFADVVQQCAHAQVVHVLFGQAQRAADQQRDDADVERMRGGAVAAAATDQADADVLVAQHAVDHGLRQRFGRTACVFWALAELVLSRAPGVGRFCVAALAALQRLALCGQLGAALCGRLFGQLGRAGRGGRRRWANDIGRGGCNGCAGPRFGRQPRGRFFGRQVALLRRPTHLLQAQTTQRAELFLRRQLEAGQRKGMRQPTTFEVDEHADANFFDGDQAGHGR